MCNENSFINWLLAGFEFLLYFVLMLIVECYTVIAIYFAHRYFRDFGLGGEICDGLFSLFL